MAPSSGNGTRGTKDYLVSGVQDANPRMTALKKRVYIYIIVESVHNMATEATLHQFFEMGSESPLVRLSL